MKREYLLEMDDASLEMYARALHTDVSGARTREVRVSLLERASSRCATVNVLGLDVEVPRAATRDMRVQALIRRRDITDDESDELMRLLVGEGQHEAILERCTDGDGRVDIDAYAVALATVITNEQVKNWLSSHA